MNFRDVAAAIESEAQIKRQTAVLEGLYQQYDQAITSRSNQPAKIAQWHFSSVSDRKVRDLAALWLTRHNNQVAPVEDAGRPVLVDEVLNKPSSRQE